MPHTGRPEMKERVPSIGSSTQTCSASTRSRPNSSPRMPCSGKRAPSSSRIAASAPLSATVTGSNAPSESLFSTDIRDRKCGRITRPDTSASSSRNATISSLVAHSLMIAASSGRAVRRRSRASAPGPHGEAPKACDGSGGFASPHEPAEGVHTRVIDPKFPRFRSLRHGEKVKFVPEMHLHVTYTHRKPIAPSRAVVRGASLARHQYSLAKKVLDYLAPQYNLCCIAVGCFI